MKFHTVVELGGKTATGFRVPGEVVVAFGKGKKPPVTVTIGQHTHRSTIAAYGDLFMLPAAGVKAGDEVEVELALDTEPRVAEVPNDMKKALAANKSAQQVFDALPYSNRRRHILSGEGAKSDETRQCRIAKILADLRENRG